MNTYTLALASLIALPVLAADPHPHHAHVHGQARLEVVVEGTELHLRLESPLEALLGFERAPRTPKERAAVDRMRQALKQADRLFVPTAAAGCGLVSTQVEAPVLETGHGADHGDGHGDLHAAFRFTCARADKLTGMEVRLADVFPRMRRVDAQVVSGRGQSAARLTAKTRFLNW